MFDQNVLAEISAIAVDLNVDLPALLAVIEVESGGKLYAHVNGKQEPPIRYEGHYFYRLLPAQKRNRAISAGLASPRAGAIKNTLGQAGRWKILRKAIKIDRVAALSSVSWGVGQVMGAHWQWLEYASVDALATDVRSGLAGQTKLMARFIEKANLVPKIQALDWAGFARSYNGPAYRKNRYDTRLAAAFQKHSMNLHGFVKPASRRHNMALLRLGSRGPQVRSMQQKLRSFGYNIAADGDFGPATEAALRAFQTENGLASDGIMGPKTFVALERIQ